MEIDCLCSQTRELSGQYAANLDISDEIDLIPITGQRFFKVIHHLLNEVLSVRSAKYSDHSVAGHSSQKPRPALKKEASRSP
jgi:hypothetical protein